MSMHARMFIGTLVIAAATLPTAARAQDAARTDGWVVLALDDYHALRSRAFPATPDPLPPPVDARSRGSTTSCASTAIRSQATRA